MPDAELSIAESNRVLNLFLAEYNAYHGTAFKLEHRVNTTDGSCDYEIQSPQQQPLKIQWTRADSSADERISLKRFQGLTKTLDDQLRATNHRGYCVDLYLGDALQTEVQEKQIAAAILFLLQEKAQEPDTGLQLCYEFSRCDVEYLSRLPTQVERVSIYKLQDPGAPTVAMVSDRAQALPTADRRAMDAVLKKVHRLGPSITDLVLVIHFDIDSYITDEIEWLKAQLENKPSGFREVWTFCEATSLENVACIVEQRSKRS